MKRYSTLLVSIVAALCLIITATSEGHTILRKPLQERYDFKSVTCFACHARGKDENGKRLGKEVLNDFGKDVKKLLDGRDVTARMEAATTADPAAKKKVHAQITAEFVGVLDKLEMLESPSGETWGQRLSEAKIDGVKKAKP